MRGSAKTVIRPDLRPVRGRTDTALVRCRRGPRGGTVPPAMTFRTKGHNKQQQQQQRPLDHHHHHLHQHHHHHQLCPAGNSLHRNRCDKPDLQLATAVQLLPPPHGGADGGAGGGGGPAAIALSAVPTAVAHPDAGGAPRIYAAYGPRCYVIQKVSERRVRVERTAVAVYVLYTVVIIVLAYR